MSKETPELRDIYITKWALTRGVIKTTGYEDGEDGRMVHVKWPGAWSGKTCFYSPDWYLTEAAAQERVKTLVAAKIDSLKKQLDKLERLAVTGAPVEDKS